MAETSKPFSSNSVNSKVINCYSYAVLIILIAMSVIETSNGLQAWKILEDLTNQIDLVLTEVIMPQLSGIGLLCKIMSHRSRKNIPVISKLLFIHFIGLWNKANCLVMNSS